MRLVSSPFCSKVSQVHELGSQRALSDQFCFSKFKVHFFRQIYGDRKNFLQNCETFVNLRNYIGINRSRLAGWELHIFLIFLRNYISALGALLNLALHYYIFTRHTYK